jgi:hypothetical protein
MEGKNLTSEHFFNGLTDEEALEKLGRLIDNAGDAADVTALEKATGLCAQYRTRDLDREHTALSYYFESNTWEELRQHRRSVSEMWDWDQPEYTHSLLALRRAWQYAQSSGLNGYRKSQILTNTANSLSHVGRVVEAIRLWNAALNETKPFPMAQGNRGRGFYYYGQRTHDPGHQFLLMRQAYRDIEDALKYNLYPQATAALEAVADDILQFYGASRLAGQFDLDHHSLGDEEEDVKYRKWGLRHGLFLTPLNELGAYTIAAADTLLLPGITGPLDQGPHHFGFFNQMKQEYVTARYSLFKGVTGRRRHYSDRGVKLVNTLDYPVYSRWIEEVKTAFRVAYSLFDKTAYFLNDYFELGIPERQVGFRTLWYEGLRRERRLRQELTGRKNIALQALFWVSRDLYEPDEYQELLEPEAQKLADIRNHIEHKYLKVHEHEPGPPPEANNPMRGLADTLAYSVGQTEFQDKTLRLLQLARATLIYLVHAVYLEERRKEVEHGDDGLIMPMYLDEYEDDWKH